MSLIGDIEGEERRLDILHREWEGRIREIGNVDDWAREELSCSRSTFYEVITTHS